MGKRNFRPMACNRDCPGPFRLDSPPQFRLGRLFWPVIRSVAERTLAFAELNSIHASAAKGPANQCFCQRVLDALAVEMVEQPEGGAVVPKTGPLVVVANHPFGGVEGLVLPAIICRVRSDVKVLGNSLLGVIPELRETLIGVDPFGSEGAVAANVGPMRRAIRWLAGGGALVVFPSGEVSHFRMSERRVVDPPWSATIGGLVRRSGAFVLPAYFPGRNRIRFQAAGMIHPRLRTLLLPREFIRQRNQRVRVRFGQVIGPGRLARFATDGSIVEYLRLRTYLLGATEGADEHRANPAAAEATKAEPIVEPEDPALLEREVQSLPPENVLVRSGPFEVCLTAAEQIPTVLAEIGRLREVTFRPIGEGTGRCRDLDAFDESYQHLFVWNRADRQIVGAYRIAGTDEIIPRQGVAGLYTHSLFRFRPELLRQIGPALELGRSFVLAEYQRSFAPLLLLWRGIGQVVARNPRYRMLFGAVSISDRYQSATRQLLVTFLRANFGDRRLSRFVRPVNPPQLARIPAAERARLTRVVMDLRDVDELVEQLESEARGMPVLLRQYLKLNARLLGFNVDPAFGNALDGLVLVDLTKVERSVLGRYLGAENAARFLAHHRVSKEPSASRRREPVRT